MRRQSVVEPIAANAARKIVALISEKFQVAGLIAPDDVFISVPGEDKEVEVCVGVSCIAGGERLEALIANDPFKNALEKAAIPFFGVLYEKSDLRITLFFNLSYPWALTDLKADILMSNLSKPLKLPALLPRPAPVEAPRARLFQLPRLDSSPKPFLHRAEKVAMPCQRQQRAFSFSHDRSQPLIMPAPEKRRRHSDFLKRAQGEALFMMPCNRKSPEKARRLAPLNMNQVNAQRGPLIPWKP